MTANRMKPIAPRTDRSDIASLTSFAIQTARGMKRWCPRTLNKKHLFPCSLQRDKCFFVFILEYPKYLQSLIRNMAALGQIEQTQRRAFLRLLHHHVIQLNIEQIGKGRHIKKVAAKLGANRFAAVLAQMALDMGAH